MEREAAFRLRGGVGQQLIQPDKATAGHKGVSPVLGLYAAQRQLSPCQTRCDTPPCHHNYLGIFYTPEEAAQAYLQHWKKEHPKDPDRPQQVEARRRVVDASSVSLVSPPPLPLPQESEVHASSAYGHTEAVTAAALARVVH